MAPSVSAGPSRPTPTATAQIAEGPYAGHTLSWLWAEHRELFGNCEGKEFPLLIKILDAKDDLSIQIHPNDEYAAEHENGSLGKTECWYVLDCEPDATIIVGQRAKDRAEAAQMIEEGRWDDMLNVLPIHKGDFFQIDSGTVHAIKTGTLILETQQSSDVTYRLYDYDRPALTATCARCTLSRASTASTLMLRLRPTAR